MESNRENVGEEGAKKWPQIVPALAGNIKYLQYLKKIKVNACVLFQATLGSFAFGMTLTWTSPALLQIDETICGDDCDISGVSEEEASWVVGIFSLAVLISAPITGILVINLAKQLKYILQYFKRMCPHHVIASQVTS